jgi:hypothetical protein
MSDQNNKVLISLQTKSIRNPNASRYVRKEVIRTNVQLFVITILPIITPYILIWDICTAYIEQIYVKDQDI